jgi:hypothetical protein
MIYAPKPKPLNSRIEKLIGKANKEGHQSMFVGWDVYVDIDGNVGFYEGNSCPFGLPAYQDLFGEDLNQQIARLFIDKGIIGVNADLRTETSNLIQQEVGLITNLFESNNIPFVCSNYANLAFNKSGLCFNEYGKRKDFNVLFNRVPWGGRIIRTLVPRMKRTQVQIVNPINEAGIISNKLKTKKALERMGLESPFSLRVKNLREYFKAAERVMQHIRDNHPNYEPPFILSKPVAGTGQKGILVSYDDREFPNPDLKFPCMVCERITTWPYSENGRDFAADIRIFTIDDYVSNGIGKIARQPLGSPNGKNQNRVPYVTKRYILKLEENATSCLQDYLLAASIAIHQYAKIKWTEFLK